VSSDTHILTHPPHPTKKSTLKIPHTCAKTRQMCLLRSRRLALSAPRWCSCRGRTPKRQRSVRCWCDAHRVRRCARRPSSPEENRDSKNAKKNLDFLVSPRGGTIPLRWHEERFLKKAKECTYRNTNRAKNEHYWWCEKKERAYCIIFRCQSIFRKWINLKFLSERSDQLERFWAKEVINTLNWP